MLGHITPGQRREIRQFGQSDIHAERAGAAAKARDAFAEVGRQRLLRDKLAIKQFRIDIGDDDLCAERIAVFA